ncbi:hypothetical protein PoB_003647000 [Plakobranchus ocellatus]|uniref:Uncharacterized protein n=1 Tax=Plakobranchus ocellatus TaxID=259542 RepID=A0AAV4ARP5_9GAST|nr:hypothetical protein PoB_003647000 [Plakobranchus ocellatus]
MEATRLVIADKTDNMSQLLCFSELQPVHNKVTSGFSGAPSGQDAGGGVRTRVRGIPADIRADSLAIVPSTPP